jgi:hypothetical protein
MSFILDNIFNTIAHQTSAPDILQRAGHDWPLSNIFFPKKRGISYISSHDPPHRFSGFFGHFYGDRS